MRKNCASQLRIALALVLATVIGGYPSLVNGTCYEDAGCTSPMVSCGGDLHVCDADCVGCGGSPPGTISIEITRAGCVGQSDCATCASSADSLEGNGIVTLSGCSGTRLLALCESWLDCNAILPACTKCSLVSRSNGSYTISSMRDGSFGCAPGTGEYQYHVAVNDITSASGACQQCTSACTTHCITDDCGGGGGPTSGAMALAASCCVEIP